jgi:hypothetical protein
MQHVQYQCRMRELSICVTLSIMNELHEQMRHWLANVLQTHGLTANRLATMIGKSPTTLTRVLNDPNAKHTLSTPTIDAIMRVTGAQPPGSHAMARPGEAPRIAMSELDGLPISPQTGDLRVDEAVRYLCQATPGLDPWRLNTRALEALGYLPGDVVITDQAATAEHGDVVVAQIYRPRGAETVFRMFAKPFLVAAAQDRVARQPLLVDDSHVAIRGVVVAMFRPRRGHLQAA